MGAFKDYIVKYLGHMHTHIVKYLGVTFYPWLPAKLKSSIQGLMQSERTFRENTSSSGTESQHSFSFFGIGFPKEVMLSLKPDRKKPL